MAKLNFVIVYQDNEIKHFAAIAIQCYENENLMHALYERHMFYVATNNVRYELGCIHYCSSKKHAEDLARAWNASYKASGRFLKEIYE